MYSTPYNYICLTLFYSVESDGKVAPNYGDSHNLISTGGFSKTKLLRFEHTRNTSNTAHANTAHANTTHANTAYHSNLCSHSTLDNVVCHMHRMCRLC